MSNDESASIDKSRIKRLVDVLSMVSVGHFDAKSIAVDVGGREDEFAFLEATVNILTRELAEAREENDRYLGELHSQRTELEQRLETIERQQLAIQELSTPIIELWDDVLTLPIVGVVDSKRSIDMTERLLHRIVEGGARCVIIDLTGVDVVDTMTADHLFKMVQGAELLGARCSVTGISPDVAQTLVRLGLDLRKVRTLRTLKEALKDAVVFLRQTKLGGGDE
jgi:rsbT co-antagonist protein RsbR